MALSLGSLVVRFGGDTRDLERSTKKVKSEVRGVTAALRSLGPAISGVLAVESARRVLMMADNFQKLNARIKLATDSAEEFVQVQSDLIRISKETGSEMSALVTTFQSIERSKESVGATTDQVTLLVENISKLGTISGATADQMSNSLLQFSQGMAGGVIRAEEFNSILENTPAIMAEIAAGMGKSQAELRQMMLDGELLSKDVFEALLKQTDKVNEQFGQMGRQMDQAATSLQTSLGIAAADLDDILGITDGIVGAMDGLADLLDGDIQIVILEIANLFQDIADRVDFMIGGFEEAGVEASHMQSVLDTISNIIGFIIEKVLELPANLRSIFAIAIGEADILFNTIKTGMKVAGLRVEEFTAKMKGALTDAAAVFRIRFTSAINAVQKQVASMLVDIAGAMDAIGADETAESIQAMADSMLAVSDSAVQMENNLKAEQEARQKTIDGIDAKVAKLWEENEAHKTMSRDIVTSMIDDNNEINENFNKASDERIAKYKEELEARRKARAAAQANREGSDISRTLGSGSSANVDESAVEAVSDAIDEVVTKNRDAVLQMHMDTAEGGAALIAEWSAAMDAMKSVINPAMQEIKDLLAGDNLTEAQRETLETHLEYLEDTYAEEVKRINQELNEALAEQDREAMMEKIALWQETLSQIEGSVMGGLNAIASITRNNRQRELAAVKQQINARKDLSEEQKKKLIADAEEQAAKQTKMEKAAWLAARAFKIANIVLGTIENVTAQGGLTTPMGVAAAISGAAQVAAAVAVSPTNYGQGRQSGGAMVRNNLIPVNENGASELLTNAAGEQFLIPGQDGMRVTSNNDLEKAGSTGRSAPVVNIINNTGVEAEAQVEMVSRDEFQVTMSRAVEQAVDLVADSLSSNQGTVARAMRDNYQVARRT